MYGTRDAAVCWEECITKVMQKFGFVQGKSSPCLFYHEKKEMSVFVHGDDFVSLGSVKPCERLREELAKHWELKERGTLGIDLKAIRILGRLVTMSSEGYTWEADPRHAEVLCAA